MGGNDELHMHFVSTHEEAHERAKGHDNYWVSNCGCREGMEGERGTPCARSRKDVCLFWAPWESGSGSGKWERTPEQVEDLFKLAKEARLVTRPFRNDKDPTSIDGICFCCDDCCGYFADDTYACDKGRSIEQTNMDGCTHCGDCEPACYFGARKMVDGTLTLDREKCYGCGLCRDVCPTDCISMWMPIG
jgi:ferredoxin